MAIGPSTTIFYKKFNIKQEIISDSIVTHEIGIETGGGEGYCSLDQSKAFNNT